MRQGAWKVSTFVALGVAGFLALRPLGGGTASAPPNAKTAHRATHTGGSGLFAWLGAGSSSDYFTRDVRFGIDAVVPTLETTAFRLVFTGDTQTLRTFVLRLASFDSPVWVRAIDVQLLPGEKKADQAVRAPTRPMAASVVLSAQPTSLPESAEAPRRVVVSKSVSQFTVVVEFVEFPAGMSAESGVQPTS